MRGWAHVATGLSGDVVRQRTDGSAYSKTAYGDHRRTALTAERDRTAWLATTSVAGPVVLDWIEEGDTATLVTSTVPGIPASDVDRDRASLAIEGVARILADLHSLPVVECPFDQRLPVMLAAARENVAAGRVDAGDFDEERRGLTAEDALRLLEQAEPTAAGREESDLVVCHGDFCLPNVLLDPDSLRPTGVIDLGLLGVSDRHRDLALVTRSISSPHINRGYRAQDADQLLGLMNGRVDPSRLAFYRLLDELF
jgi:aminoglycoside phosphotransferase